MCQFLNILKKDLPYCRPSSLETIFSQCMYFGQSLSHIGADFRGLIAPVFINVTVKRFSDLLKITEKTWLTDLQTFLKTNIKNVRMNQTHDEVRYSLNYIIVLLLYYVFIVNSLMGICIRWMIYHHQYLNIILWRNFVMVL